MSALDNLPKSVKSLVEPGIDMELVLGTATVLIGFYIASYVLSVLQGLIMTTVTQRISRGLRAEISAKINRLPMSYFNRVFKRKFGMTPRDFRKVNENRNL